MLAGSAPGIFRIPTCEELISVADINEIDVEWINSEVKYLETFGDVDPTNKNPKKEVLTEKINSIADKAKNISNLIRTLHRLAKVNSNTAQLCTNLVADITSQLGNSSEIPVISQNSVSSQKYSEVLKLPQNPNQTDGKKVELKTRQVKEVTIHTKNYERDCLEVKKQLNTVPISSIRKSKTGNIVLTCPSLESEKTTLAKLEEQNSLKIFKSTKILPKMTITGIEEESSTEEILESILTKNPTIKDKVDAGFKLEILFTKSGKNSTQVAVIKVDPEIRHVIKSLNYRVFIGFKMCYVYDRVHFKVCYNCQVLGEHLSDNCPVRNKTICRFCTLNHRSSNCPNKTDASKHVCYNCSQSSNEKFRENCRTHYSNHSECPIAISVMNNVILNTKYEIQNSKND